MMTEDDYRRLALSLPEAVEGEHMSHPDFRVRGRIFATLGPAGSGFGFVSLTPDEQAALIRTAPDVFAPAPGAWGRRGYTKVWLRAADPGLLRPVLVSSWRKTAPKRLAAKHEGL